MKNIFKLYNIFLFLLIIFFIGLSYIFQDEKSTLNKDTQDRINTQSNYINEYFTINKAFILSLKNTLTSNFYIEDLVHPAFNEIQNKPTLGTYNILCNLNNVQSTLNGDKTLSNITLDTVQELNSALYLHPLFRTILNSNHDIKWVYYTSAKNFIYLAPSNDIWDDKFLKYQFTKEFWTEAIPENNPSGELVLTKVYDDGMGKGYITTLSLPIFKDDVFMGVLSIDIGIEKLNKMISDIKVQGKLYLINEDDLIIASNQKFKLNEEIEESKETFSINIFENRLKLIYIEDKSERILTIIYSALPMIMLLFFILVIVYILIYQIVLIKKIKELADKDSLTFLLNRRAMTKECTRQLSIAKRYEQDTSLLLLDIDFFKRVNDTYGHHTGDITLQEIAKILKKEVRESDLVSRHGGEEFLILLNNTNNNDAFLLAERIRKEISNLKIRNVEFPITISIGCTQYLKDESLDSFINRADVLLYKAKDEGRNQTIKG